jgi:hypothetical protein
MSKKSSMNVRTVATASKTKMRQSAIKIPFTYAVTRGHVPRYLDTQRPFTYLQRALMKPIHVDIAEKISPVLASLRRQPTATKSR